MKEVLTVFWEHSDPFLLVFFWLSNYQSWHNRFSLVNIEAFPLWLSHPMLLFHDWAGFSIFQQVRALPIVALRQALETIR